MEEKMKIFFCEDDENLGMLLREYLQAKGMLQTFSVMEKQDTKGLQRRNTIFVCWM